MTICARWQDHVTTAISKGGCSTMNAPFENFVGVHFCKIKKYKKLLYLSIFSTLLRFGPSTHAGMGLVRTGKRMGSLSPA
jgi:hypothetical protein